MKGRRLGHGFYARPSDVVAPALLGHVLVRQQPGGERLAARVVEAEAYGPDDPASHAFRGPTPRNATMFGPPGHLYVYFTYGMHFCMNVVCGRDGEGSAVLLRAGEPLEGFAEMARRRGRERSHELCAGPARWTQAFGIGREHDGEDLVRGEVVWLERGRRSALEEIVEGPRVGVRAGLDRAWRFQILGNPFVSRGRPTVQR